MVQGMGLQITPLDTCLMVSCDHFGCNIAVKDNSLDVLLYIACRLMPKVHAPAPHSQAPSMAYTQYANLLIDYTSLL